MKSKSPSAASKKSTLNRWFGRSAGERWRDFEDAISRGKRPCAAILLTLLLPLAACYVPPGAHTQATQPQGVPHTHTITIQTPTPAWKLVPMMLYRTSENEYLCVHTLTAPDGMVAQMLSTTSNQISFQHSGSDNPVIHHYILGKTWNWNGNPELTFIDSLDEIKDALADARSVPFTTP